MLSRVIPILIILAALAALAGCAGGAANAPAAPDGATTAQLRAALDQEFARLGIDPDRVVAAAPAGPGNAVFDLTAVVVDPDGAGPEPPTGVLLSFSERAVGDYDQNGEVNASDLTPLGAYWRRTVAYEPTVMFNGIPYVPTGDPTDDGGAGAGNPPAEGSGAENWRLARVDGDFNTEINIADITPLAIHWQQRLDGYQVYRKGPGETVYSMLPNADDPLAGVSILHSAAQPGRPVLLSFTDHPPVDGTFEYYVAPVDQQVPEEGPQSNLASVDWAGPPPPVNEPPVAALIATPDTGVAPLNVQLDGSGSTDSDGAIVKYEFDPESTGTWIDSGTDATYDYTYAAAGTYTASLRVTDDDGAMNTTTATVTVNPPSDASITGKVEVLTADWPDPFTPQQKAPLPGVVIYVYGEDHSTVIAQSQPTDANGDYSIYGVPDGLPTIYIEPLVGDPAITKIIAPISGYFLEFAPVFPLAVSKNFVDSGGFHYPGEA